MIYLYLYLGIGLLCGVGLSARNIGAGIWPRPWYWRALLALLVFSLFWPPLVLGWWRDSRWQPPAPLPEFAVTAEHLQEALTLVEIEARERPSDPLGAVPELPFGHLNGVWLAFLAECTDGAEFRCFVAEWDTGWCRERREGYVEVVDGQPGRYIMTLCKTLQNN